MNYQERHSPNSRYTEFENKTSSKVQIPVSHARRFTITVAEMKASTQITSTRPMLSVIVGFLDPQTLIINFSPATPYTFTSQFSSKEPRYSNLCSFPKFQLHGHPSDVTLGLVVTSCVGETLAPRASNACEQGSQTLTLITVNTYESLDPSSQTLVSSQCKIFFF